MPNLYTVRLEYYEYSKHHSRIAVIVVHRNTTTLTVI